MGVQGTQGGGIYYAPWMKEQIAFNTAYDDFVRMLLTAEGYAWDNPAVGYYMRDEGMPLRQYGFRRSSLFGHSIAVCPVP